MSNKTIEELAYALTVALNSHERAKQVYVPEENPFANHDLTAMTKAGLRKSADNYPAINMASVRNPMLGIDLEMARNAAMEEGRADTGAKRKAMRLARQQKLSQITKVDESSVVPSKARLHDAWAVVMPLVPTIMRIAEEKARWAARYLGNTVEDIPQVVLEKMALWLAKQDKYDLDDMLVAATAIGDQERSTGKTPGDQGAAEVSDEERKYRKDMRRMRKLLMQVINNRTHAVLIDTYRNEQNLRWDTLDVVETVMAAISGVGGDPMMNSFKASRAPAFLGTRFQAPDGINAGLLAAGINAAITERGLDPLVEFMLDDTHRRTDGAIHWSEYAEQIFKLTPLGQGDWMWDAVVSATTVRRDGKVWPMDRARKARGDAARAHVRNLFGFLPRVITGLVDAFDPHPIGFSTNGTLAAVNDDGDVVRLTPRAKSGRVNAVMASDFELFYAPVEPEMRQFLSPILRFGTVEEAARALLEHLSELVTGEDLVRSVVAS